MDEPALEQSGGVVQLRAVKISRLRLLVLVAFLAGGARLSAAIVFANPEQDFHPKPGEPEVVAKFQFENKGDKPVKITNVHASCGCTTTALAKQEYAPGEKGELTATFKIGDRIGEQVKTIAVTTDDPAAPNFALKLKATIPVLLQLTPTFLYWPPGEELKPKVIDVKVGPEFPIKKIDVQPSIPAVETRVEPGANEKEFRIVVTPKPASQPVSAVLKITTDDPSKPPKAFYASVRLN